MPKVYIWTNTKNEITGFSHTPQENTREVIVEDDFLIHPFKYKFENGKCFVCDELERMLKARRPNRDYQKFLNETDWKVTRHRDQLDLGIETSLTSEEFQELLELRQNSRNNIVN